MPPISLFEGIAPASLDRLERSAAERHYDVGEAIHARGEAPREVTIITKGRVKIWRGLENGVVMTLGLLKAGEFIGLAGALSELPRSSNATALSPVTAISWRAATVMEEVSKDIRLAMNVNRLMARYVRGVADRMEELAAQSAERRLARVLIGLAREIGEDGAGQPVHVDVTQNDLAELARTTVPTVSRCLTRWRLDGVVQARRGRIMLLDPARLREIGRDAG